MALPLNGEESLEKLENYPDPDLGLTTIQSIGPCHTPNLSAKFHPNPSTMSWDIMLYILFAPISQWWRITLKILVVRSGSGSSPKSNRFVVVTHPTCPPSFIQICPQLFEISCYISVQPHHSMVKNHLKKLSDPDSDLNQNLINLSLLHFPTWPPSFVWIHP